MQTQLKFSNFGYKNRQRLRKVSVKFILVTPQKLTNGNKYLSQTQLGSINLKPKACEESHIPRWSGAEGESSKKTIS